MSIQSDPDLLSVVEFMQAEVPADKLVSLSLALSRIAPALWGHFQATEVRALTLGGAKPRQEAASG